MPTTLLDRMIGYFNPRAGLERLQARASFEHLQSKMAGASKAGYGPIAGRNRLNAFELGDNLNENAIPRWQIASLREQSWRLFRMNPHARKIVRNMTTNVIGKRGPQLQSLATTDGSMPFKEFRDRAERLWRDVQAVLDWSGLPGMGGLSLAELHKVAFISVVLGGAVLLRIRPLSAEEQAARRSPVPLAVQLIHPARLTGDAATISDPRAARKTIFDGIEVDGDGRRVAYWILNRHPSETHQNGGAELEYTRVPATEVRHLYISDDVDQYHGVPWFAPAIRQFQDVGDYQFNETTAAKLAACAVIGYRQATGGSSRGLGLNASVDGPYFPNDADGNPITRMSPGMIIPLGADGELVPVPIQISRTQGAEQFTNHLLRSAAAAFPGVKGSTVTGDHRNSSFTAERSADNECWPEIEAIQEWMFAEFTQPIYEAVLRAAVMDGYFEEIVTAGQFNENGNWLTRAQWQGPVARSLNPVDDAKSSIDLIRGGLSSQRIECAKRGINWLSVLADTADFLAEGKAAGLEDSLLLKMLAVETGDNEQKQTPNASNDSSDDDPTSDKSA